MKNMKFTSMGKKTAHLLSRNLLSTAAVIALMGASAFAAAPAGGYLPGATLDPDCAPSDTDCIVQNVGTETDPLRKFVDGSGSLNAVYTGGYVGIGTDNPSRDLTIASDNSYIYTRFEPGDGNIWSTGPDSAGYSFWEGSTRRVSIDNGGNVGIGTTAPTNKLEISDTGTGTLSLLRLENRLGSGTEQTGAGIDFAHFSLPEPGAQISSQQYGTSGYNASLIFKTESGVSYPNGLEERMRIGYDGNVGIGTTTPRTKLDVQISDDTSFVKNHTSGGSNYRPTGTDVLHLKNNGTTGAPVGVFLAPQSSSGSTGERAAKIEAVAEVGVNYGTSLLLKTRNTAGTLGERLRITGNGNVGIGEANPLEELVVAKTGGAILRLSTGGNSPSSVNGIEFHDRENGAGQTGTGQIGSYMKSLRSGTSGYYNLAFGTVATTAGDAIERMRIRGDGKVGIGTTNPDAQLTVEGTTGALFNVYNGTNRHFQITGNGSKQFYDNTGTQIITMLNNGNMGIGTTSPVNKFEVETDGAYPAKFSSSHSSLGRVLVENTGGGSASIRFDTSAGGAFNTIGTDGNENIIGSYAGPLVFKQSNSERVRINVDGSMGVGTNDPKVKLDVNGAVKVGNAVTCDADRAGSIKFNAGQFQGCTGTAWVNLH